jgi:prepilin-type N-terminal cleavage/methylation domain-containing protein
MTTSPSLRQRSGAFTLIEFLVVIAIIAHASVASVVLRTQNRIAHCDLPAHSYGG